MDYRETMRAEQAPDIYDGPDCDQHRPQWVGSADGDKDGDGPIGETIELAANTFPPGTKVTISEPSCPHCEEGPTFSADGDLPGKWKCGCDFDWRAWAEEQYS